MGIPPVHVLAQLNLPIIFLKGIALPFSKVSYATSSNKRCAGSIPAASLAVIEKNGASNRDGSSFRKNPLSWFICSICSVSQQQF
jgi:hypothetical protein